MAKAILILPLLAAFAYAAIVGVIYFSQHTLLYPGASAGFAPETPAWGEAVSIATPDGETLHGLYQSADAGKSTVLFFLGNADRAAHHGLLASTLTERGIGLLAVSYRGYPGSSGSPSEAGLLIDGIAAFDWLSARSGDGIVVLGQSLGSGVAVNTASERPAVGVILVSAYVSVLALAKSHYPYLPVGLLLKDRFRSDLKIARVTQPKLFIHGRRDDVIPLSFGEALYAMAPEPKEMLIYDAYGHNDLWDEGMLGDVVGFVQGLGR
jgi:uncharacterized protein